MLLSIIIPYYNTLNKTINLVNELHRQCKKHDNIEIIIIDDGCYCEELRKLVSDNTLLIQKRNEGVSIARNKGIAVAKGDYIAFIDSDDMIAPDYIEKIINKTNYKWDYCLMSWKSDNSECIIIDHAPSWNTCVWNCIYKKDLIGNNRFNPNLQIGEDYDFNKRVRKGKRANITDIMYYYNSDRKESLTNLYRSGIIKENRESKVD